MLSCLICGRECAGRHRNHGRKKKYCSLACYNVARSRVKKTCETCGVEFEVRNRPADKARYCSWPCTLQARRIRKHLHRPYMDKPLLIKMYVESRLTTEQIGKSFGVSGSCIVDWLREYRIPARSPNEYERPRGPESPRYINGQSTLRMKLYGRREWAALRRVVVPRDKVCRHCGQPKIKVVLHHIKSWSGFPESRLDPDNVVLLCKACHDWVHSKRNTNHEFLSAFTASGTRNSPQVAPNQLVCLR